MKEIQRLLKEGHTMQGTCEEIWCEPSVIYRRGKAPYLGRFIPLETKNKIIKKIKEGYTKAEAAQIYNVPVNTVRGFTKGLGAVKARGTILFARTASNCSVGL